VEQKIINLLSPINCIQQPNHCPRNVIKRNIWYKNICPSVFLFATLVTPINVSKYSLHQTTARRLVSSHSRTITLKTGTTCRHQTFDQ